MALDGSRLERSLFFSPSAPEFGSGASSLYSTYDDEYVPEHLIQDEIAYSPFLLKKKKKKRHNVGGDAAALDASADAKRKHTAATSTTTLPAAATAPDANDANNELLAMADQSESPIPNVDQENAMFHRVGRPTRSIRIEWLAGDGFTLTGASFVVLGHVPPREAELEQEEEDEEEAERLALAHNKRPGVI